MRVDGRQHDELRKVTLSLHYVSYAEGSVLIQQGDTKVLCNVTVEETVPKWIQAQGKTQGWVTGEYALLPRSTHMRTPRETTGISGRSHEIRRLIGRSLRAALDLEKLGSRTLILDCDVIQADGGTRTTAVTGGYIAMGIALNRLVKAGKIPADTLRGAVAAVSVGVVAGQPLLDLCYAEDSQAQIDCNVVMNDRDEYIEVQATAEGNPFPRATLDDLLSLANSGIHQLMEIQREALRTA